MSLYAKLCERAAQGRPLIVGVIGAGKFGAMYLAQVPKTPGVHVVGIADLAPANARGDQRTSASGMCDLVAGCRYTPPFGVTTETVGRLSVVRNPPR